jgi:DNA-binding LacI/PurR family transcriptional regulator
VEDGGATIRDVARRAGVSKSLVSLVLRGSSSVSPERRAAVQDAIEELGYRPNGIARSLASRRTNAIGVLIDDLRNGWHADLVDGLNSVLATRGQHILLGDHRLDRRADESVTRAFVDLRVDGLVLAGSMLPSEAIVRAARQVPTVVAGSRGFEVAGVDIVADEDERGGHIATRHLIDLGHRRIVHVAGIGEVGRLRLAGYRRAMAEAGLEEETAVEPGDTTEEGGYRAAVRFLNRARRPSAVFAYNDVTAVGVLDAAIELGIRVPAGLSIVGYDNSHMARMRHLFLTTVDPVSFEVGRRAAMTLLERIEDPRRPAVEVLLEPRLEVRTSTAAPMDMGTAS